MRSLVLIVVFAAACGSSSDSSDAAVVADLSMPGVDMQLLSRCGHPGDTGNSLGVGKFCSNDGPNCVGNGMALLCSALVNGQTPSADDAYFCTFQCSSTDPPDVCGENAACLCDSAGAGCACIPNRCITATADGGP